MIMGAVQVFMVLHTSLEGKSLPHDGQTYIMKLTHICILLFGKIGACPAFIHQGQIPFLGGQKYFHEGHIRARRAQENLYAPLNFVLPQGCPHHSSLEIAVA